MQWMQPLRQVRKLKRASHKSGIHVSLWPKSAPIHWCNFILTKRVLAEFEKHKLTPQVLHYSPNLSSVWNIVGRGIAFSVLTGNGILPDSSLAAVPIAGFEQKGFIVTKKGRQIYADERSLIDFFKQKFVAK